MKKKNFWNNCQEESDLIDEEFKKYLKEFDALIEEGDKISEEYEEKMKALNQKKSIPTVINKSV